MVEYVLGGSPTNKESPLTLEPRLRGLKIDEGKVREHSTRLTDDDDSENSLFLSLAINKFRAMMIRRIIHRLLRLTD